ncbi:MAG TPA: ABC transporter substrate-binding protein [Blastocatellia bacterium]|nr:ABC transporter substrate-binding protein [Blastocatellia bacterium]
MTNTRFKAGTTLLLAAAALIVCGLDRASGAMQSRLSLAEKRGKQIYLHGTSPSGGKITAFLRDAAVEVPASALTCVNCHGYRGEGKPEGGVVPSVITWEFLTKPYGMTDESGRKRPPYTEKSLELCLIRGFDPAGNRVAGSMPVYQMRPEDMRDLIDYLKVLGSDPDPGVTGSALRLGTIIPGEGSARETGIAVKSALAAYFAEVNEQGGVYSRRIDLRVLEVSTGSLPVSGLVEKFIRDEDLFAMTGAFIAGSEQELAAAVEKEELPLVGPVTLLPRVESPPKRQIFYLYSGLQEQAAAILNFASSTSSGAQRVGVVYPQIEPFSAAVSAVESECQTLNWPAPEKLSYARGLFDAAQAATRLKQLRFDVVFLYTNSAETLALLNRLSGSKWSSQIFLPGALVDPELLKAPKDVIASVHASFPTLPLDHSLAGIAELQHLAKKHSLPRHHLVAQINAVAAAKVLVEALKIAGRDVSREKLITTLEGFYQFQTGLTPPITFGLNRRIGALGAYIVSIDPDKREFIPVSNWIALN